jgi:hypothetical protein
MLLLFALTLFISATLLFLVQPMIGKMLLPMLGGTPAVWNTCMVFFQALLLAGYAYAHATTGVLGVRRQALLHLGVLLVPFLTLSLTINRGLLDYGEGSPIPGLLLVLVLSVGLPFFVVSCSAPLLQMWFAGTGHPAARDPYFLYGASNLGSMLALVSYPAVIEPWLVLTDQRRLWQIGYVVLVVAIALCALSLWRSPNPDKKEEEMADGKGGLPAPFSDSVSLSRQLRWIALAFVPSSLMLGATTYMTTDIAAIPLLWVLPLGLYLLSFILVFSRLPAVVHRFMVTVLPFLVLLLVFLMLSEFPLRIWWKIVVHLLVLFVAAMVCHGELARDRPSTRHLTGFYLCMSVGGVLGGLFNALAAPMIFNGIVEYPLALVLACILMPALDTPRAKEEDFADVKKTPVTPTRRSSLIPGALLIGLYAGAGVALLIPALGRSDLNFNGMSGGNGLWLVVAVAGCVALSRVYRRGPRDDRSARWLDLALPAALGLLAIGLNLGLRITTMHRGLEHLFWPVYNHLPRWVPAQLATFLEPSSTNFLILFIYVLPVVLCAFFLDRPLRFGLGIAALLLGNSFCDLLDEDVLLRQRSFFGVLHVTDDGAFRRLEHGTTLHGMQRLQWDRTTLSEAAVCSLAAADPLSTATLMAAGEDHATHPGREPQTYFHRTGPIGQVFAAYKDHFAGGHLALIGLGSGTLASYGQTGQKVTYYEIDPVVKRIAYNPAYFTYIQDALDRKVDLDVVLGDARLKLEERANSGPPDKFALLVIDAFSSDAIPIHLITRQALDIYLKNVAEDGLIAFHISNRYLDLDPVLGNLAAEVGLVGYIENDRENDIPGKASSSWVVLARQQGTLDRLVHEDRWKQWQTEHGWAASGEALQMLSAIPDASGGIQTQAAAGLALLEGLKAPWRKLKVRPEVGVWTDDYSNLLRVFEWKY